MHYSKRQSESAKCFFNVQQKINLFFCSEIETISKDLFLAWIYLASFYDQAILLFCDPKILFIYEKQRAAMNNDARHKMYPVAAT